MTEANQLPKTTTPTPWPYTALDPAEVSQRAYRYLSDGGCMYAAVGSVVHTLAERLGPPHDSFPLEMMTYGRGGMGGFGSICGAINGAAAVIGIYCPADRQGTLVRKLLRWFTETELPIYSPEGTSEGSDTEHETASSVNGTVDCHPSLASWREAVGRRVNREERRVRCARITADAAAKAVELLNAELT